MSRGKFKMSSKTDGKVVEIRIKSFVEIYRYISAEQCIKLIIVSWFQCGCMSRGKFKMMMSWNGNIFRVTGPLCREFTGHRWIPRTKASDAELWCFLWSDPNKRLGKQSWGWWFETPSRSLWRHRNEKSSDTPTSLRRNYHKYIWHSNTK